MAEAGLRTWLLRSKCWCSLSYLLKLKALVTTVHMQQPARQMACNLLGQYFRGADMSEFILGALL